MKVGAVVQARMGSTRLPGKVMLDICGKPIIYHVIERLKQCKNVDEIIIATTILKQDEIIVEEASKNNVKFFRGSEEDVLSRYYHAARENSLDVIVRVTSDCPLIDPLIIDKVVDCFTTNECDMATNVSIDLSMRTFPRGLDVEVFSFESLEYAFKNANKKYQREHVTPYFYENSNRIIYYKNDADLSEYRWTLDTDDDLKLISFIYKYLYRGKHNFYFRDVLKLLEEHQEMKNINAHVEQKKIRI